MVVGEEFDKEAVKPESGVRAIWLLYKRGQWGALADFGLEREKVEPLFKRFESDRALLSQPGRHALTIKQCRALVKLVPEVGAAAKELRLAYYLKFYDKGKGKEVSLENVSRGGHPTKGQSA